MEILLCGDNTYHYRIHSPKQELIMNVILQKEGGFVWFFKFILQSWKRCTTFLKKKKKKHHELECKVGKFE